MLSVGVPLTDKAHHEHLRTTEDYSEHILAIHSLNKAFKQLYKSNNAEWSGFGVRVTKCLNEE